MGAPLFVTCESGKLAAFDTDTHQLQVLYQDPLREVLFGITCHEDRIYLSGSTRLTMGRTTSRSFEPVKISAPFCPVLRGEGRHLMRWFWSRVGAHGRAIPYDKPGLHQMNLYHDQLFVTATIWNEVWALDRDLNLRQCIPMQPRVRDYYHLNNVFCDGTHFYVCLYKFRGRAGSRVERGGYAKFDLDWYEVERRALGWESHALSVIDGEVLQLCCNSGHSQRVDALTSYSRRAGLLVNHELMFEYDSQRYYCKDFSMNDDRIYLVGGSTTERAKRAESAGVVLVLTREYGLVKECTFPGIGGFNGCRLPGLDYSKGYAPGEPGTLAGFTKPAEKDDRRAFQHPSHGTLL